MFKNVHQINAINRLGKKLTGFSNADLIADTLSNNGTLVPVCPIGNYVYRYDPCYQRVLRLKVVEIKYTETECFYDLECYENGVLITYFSIEEKEFGARCYLTRSAAKRNTNIVSVDNARIIKNKTRSYFKDSLKFIYNKETSEGFFREIETEKLLSFRAGLKRIISVDNSDEIKNIVKETINHE
jgi:hypothetical protein